MYPENNVAAANPHATGQLAGAGRLMPYEGKEPEYPYPGKHEAAKEQRLPLNEQEKAIAELHSLIGELADHMQAVLLPERDDAKAALANITEPMGSMLNLQLKGNNNQIFRAANRVRDLIDRLDV